MATKTSSPKPDHAHDTIKKVTDSLIAALESGTVGEWIKPWKCGLPHNVEGRNYSGMNILVAYFYAQTMGFSSNTWGTYKQWEAKGCQVKKGSKAVYLLRLSKIRITKTDSVTGEETVAYIPKFFAFPVFNADQVDGWKGEVTAPPTTREDLEKFIEGVGASITWGGNIAAYSPREDKIVMPSRAAFHDQGGMYSTAFHELIHWTGAPKRLGRDLTGRFGSEHYAAEELVAELGAAMLCASFGVNSNLREDHAAYLGHWLKVLKETPSALTTVATKASEAMNFLLKTTEASEEETAEVAAAA